VIVDSSAIIAVLQKEPEAARLGKAMSLDPECLVSAANWLEAGMNLFLRFGQQGVYDLQLFVAKTPVEIVSVTPRQADLALRAFTKYGKGVDPARINFGDCFAYALAKDTGEPLLFKGEDFTKTDIQPVAY
jgi:ribonuclease VapC